MVNYLAVLIAAIAAFAVGALWYSVLFGRVWRKEMSMGEMQGSMNATTQSMIGSFVATLIMVYVLALSMNTHNISTTAGALTLAFWIWLGFIATVMSNMVWYEKKSWTLYFVNVAHYLVALLVAAAVLLWLS